MSFALSSVGASELHFFVGVRSATLAKLARGADATSRIPIGRVTIPLQITLEKAHAQDVAAIAALRVAVAERLTRDFGHGHWSAGGTESGVIRDMATPGLFLVREGARVIATLRLAAKKPWAIDPAHFSASQAPLYLTSMAVDPDRQRQGIGRACMSGAFGIARDKSADAIRLDAYDAPAGAGGFYEKCGFCEVARVVYRETPLIYYELLLT